MMEGSPKQCSKLFPFRRVHDTGLLGCFMAPRLKRQAPSSPDSNASTSSKEDFFSSDDPDVNPLFTMPNSSTASDHEDAANLHKLPTKCAKSRTGSRHLSAELLIADTAEATEESFVFYQPAPSDVILESPSFRTLSDPLLSTFSYNCAPVTETSISSKAGLNFGGLPQPLPPPSRNSNAVKRMWLPLPTPTDSVAPRGSISSNSELRFMSGASSFVSTSNADVTSQGVGSWSIRRGKVAAPVGGLPLPPPSVATKLLPGLEAFEFEDLVHGTREFAHECCMEKGEFGAVYRAWVKGAGSGKFGRGLAVVRLTVNKNQVTY